MAECSATGRRPESAVILAAGQIEKRQTSFVVRNQRDRGEEIRERKIGAQKARTGRRIVECYLYYPSKGLAGHAVWRRSRLSSAAAAPKSGRGARRDEKRDAHRPGRDYREIRLCATHVCSPNLMRLVCAVTWSLAVRYSSAEGLSSRNPYARDRSME